MLKPLLTGSAVFILLLVSSLPAFAQPQAPEAAPPAPNPAPPQGGATPKPEAPRAEVSQADLQKFAKAIKQIRAIEQEAETRMVQAIEKEGLTPQQFIQILQAQQTPEGQPNQQGGNQQGGVSQEELQKFEKISTQITEVQREAQSRMERAVQAQGLETQRFQQILAAVRQDPALQQEVQRMIQN